MAKIVIAGKASCPRYSKVELLADSLVKNLDSFQLHKIVKSSDEWEEWLSKICEEKNFVYKDSPLVWRELVDRGGKGILIGGANEFQEYANGYYGVKSSFTSTDMTKIAEENVAFKKEIDEETAIYKSLSKPMKICISNAASDICYHMINSIASGDVFGENTELTLNLLAEEEKLPYLEGIEMEIMDMAHNLLREVCVTSNSHQAFMDCEVVVLLDQLNREVDESEENWLRRNVNLYVERAKLLDENCKKEVKVLIAGSGPVNTCLSVILQNIKNINKQNIIAMPRLTENQAKAILAQKVKVNSDDIVDVVCWGDQEKYYCDIAQARVHNHDGPIWGPSFYSRLVNLLIHEEHWLQKDFTEALEVRLNTEKELLKRKPAFSQAFAITSLLTHWWKGSPEGQMFTLTVASEGWYNVPDSMVFNFPVRFLPAGSWVVVQDIDLSAEAQKHIQECVQYLYEQKYILYPELRPTPPPEKPADASDSPHPPTMTPIKEETDNEVVKQPEHSTSDEITDYVTDTEHNQTEIEQAEGAENEVTADDAVPADIREQEDQTNEPAEGVTEQV